MPKKKTTPKRSRGAPSKYKPEYAQMLEDHMAEGYSFESFGAMCTPRVCEKTLHNWLKEFPEFLQSKQVGNTASRYRWEKFGLDGVMSTDGVHLNTGTWRLNMINRFGWKDKHEIDADVTTKTDESEQVQQLLAQLKTMLEIK
jgi:hypothetical protein